MGHRRLRCAAISGAISRAVRQVTRPFVRQFAEQLEPRRLLAAAVGPDAFGYQADATAVETINLHATDPGVITVVGYSDDEAEPIDLGANTFTFYGAKYSGASQLFAGSNGQITFGAGSNDNSSSDFNTVPGGYSYDAATIDPIIAPLWDDWIGSNDAGAQILAKFEDTGGSSAPDRLIVQWNTEPYSDSSASYDDYYDNYDYYDDYYSALPAALPAGAAQSGAAQPAAAPATADAAAATATPTGDGAGFYVTFQAILQLNTGNKPGDLTFNYEDVDTGDANSNGANSAVGIHDYAFATDNKLPISTQGTGDGPQLIGSGKAIKITNTASGQPFADAGGPYTVEEADVGKPLTLDGSGSSDPDQAANTLQYAWDLDNDGIFGETGADASNGDETGIHPTLTTGAQGNTVYLRVTDSANHSSYSSAQVTIHHPAPTLAFTGPTSGYLSVPVKIALSASDVAQDTDFSWNVDWGDGNTDYSSGESGSTSVEHTYTDQGSYTISVTVSNSFVTSDPKTQSVTIGARPDALLTTDGTLVVTTGSGNDTIVIDTSGGNARLSRDGTVTTYPLANVKAIDIDAGDGVNSVTCSLAGTTDSIVTGSGADMITVTAAMGDTVTSGDGADTITSGSGEDYIDAGDGNNVVTVGPGEATVLSGAGNDRVSLDSGDAETGAGNDTIIGGTGGVQGEADSVTVNAGDGDDSITSADGSDYISSGEGNDTVSSGGGNDFLTTGGDASTNTGAIIDAGAGDDFIGATYAKAITGGDGNDGISEYFGGMIDCGAGDDIVHAGSDATRGVTVFGGDGRDKIYTGEGNDRIYGGAGSDTVHAGLGDDFVNGGGGNDHLFGQGGADRLYGGRGTNRLDGGDGDDLLTGGPGVDIINGGEGHNSAHRDDPLDVLTDIQGDIS